MSRQRGEIRTHTIQEQGQQGDRQESFVIARITEVVIPDDAPDPRPNRATRRAAQRRKR